MRRDAIGHAFYRPGTSGQHARESVIDLERSRASLVKFDLGSAMRTLRCSSAGFVLICWREARRGACPAESRSTLQRVCSGKRAATDRTYHGDRPCPKRARTSGNGPDNEEETRA